MFWCRPRLDAEKVTDAQKVCDAYSIPTPPRSGRCLFATTAISDRRVLEFTSENYRTLRNSTAEQKNNSIFRFCIQRQERYNTNGAMAQSTNIHWKMRT